VLALSDSVGVEAHARLHVCLIDDDLWNTGKDYIKVPVSRLLSRSYARELASRIKKGSKSSRQIYNFYIFRSVKRHLI